MSTMWETERKRGTVGGRGDVNPMFPVFSDSLRTKFSKSLGESVSYFQSYTGLSVVYSLPPHQLSHGLHN